MENLKSIKKYPIFKNIEENDISCLLRCFGAKIIKKEKNTRIIKRGEKIIYLAIVIEGSLRDTIYDEDGMIHTHFDYNEGDVIGLEYFNNKKSYLSDITAITDVKLLLLNAFRIITPCENFCKRHTLVLTNIIKELAKENTRYVERIKELTMGSSKEKIMYYLHNQSVLKKSLSFEISYNRQELAQYLGIERAALSRELSNLAKEGKINYHKNHFEILEK